MVNARFGAVVEFVTFVVKNGEVDPLTLKFVSVPVPEPQVPHAAAVAEEAIGHWPTPGVPVIVTLPQAVALIVPVPVVPSEPPVPTSSAVVLIPAVIAEKEIGPLPPPPQFPGDHSVPS
jgi:hypothetical protein